MSSTEATPPGLSSRDAMLDGSLSSPEILGRSRYLLGALAVLALVVLVGALSFEASWRQGLLAVRTNADHRLELFASAVEGILNRLEHVPATIQLNQDVLQLLAQQGHPERVRNLAPPVNTYLRKLNHQLGSLAVYVLDERGYVVASSNANEPGSFVGEDLSFRPYFLTALSGEVGRHFAIGNSSKQPGYYLSNPVRDAGQVVGVAVIKIAMTPIEQAWSMLGAPALITDENQVIIIASQPGWQYRSLIEPSVDKLIEWQMNQRYDLHKPSLFTAIATLGTLSAEQATEGVLLNNRELDPHMGRTLLAQSFQLDKMQWRLWTFTDVDLVRKQAVMVSLLSCVAAGFFCLVWLAIHQRQRLIRQKLAAKQMLERANAELESKVARRTSALTHINERLRREIAERAHAEETLREAQDELIQSAKLAAVGQMSAGITHELAQPVGAIRTLSSNSSAFLTRGDIDTVRSNLALISRLADQMGELIQSLKGFARKAPGTPAATDVAQAVNNALLLFVARIRQDEVTLINDCQEGVALVWCDPNRLEQVIVNLLGNALDALRDATSPTLHLHSAIGQGRVQLFVDDNGSGLPDAPSPRLFEPFFTTKPHGLGLGLGLSISRDIIRSFHGELMAANRPEGGARFIVDLPERLPDEASGSVAHL